MNDNTKLEIAKEVMATMIALRCKKGFDPNDAELLKLLDERKEMGKFNIEVIDKIINVYGPIVRNGGQK